MTKTKLPILMAVLSVIALTACQSVQHVSIEYMLPAETSFPAEVRKVAIVNNVSKSSDNGATQLPDPAPKKQDEVKRTLTYCDGDPTITTEVLAQEIASKNYFDQVIICDSALRSADHFARETTLSQEDVQTLTTDLKVDALIAVEKIQLHAQASLAYLREFDIFSGMLNVVITPTIKIYLPNRKTPVITFHPHDSISWTGYGETEAYAFSEIASKEEMIEEASEFAGIFPADRLLPHWKTSTRYLYTNGSSGLRDAALYVRKNQWKEAVQIWKKEYETSESEKKKKAKAAMNIAFYYEQNDSIDQAYDWAIKAHDAAFKAEKIGTDAVREKGIEGVPLFHASSLYVNELEERKESFARLRMQMQRFGSDF